MITFWYYFINSLLVIGVDVVVPVCLHIFIRYMYKDRFMFNCFPELQIDNYSQQFPVKGSFVSFLEVCQVVSYQL